MENELHLLLAVALVAGLLRPSDPAPYLVAIATVAVPMIDRYLLTPLVRLGALAGPIWVHRSVTHSILVGVLVVLAAAAVGQWRAGAIGFLAHVVPDLVFGGVRPFLPFDTTVVRVYSWAHWPANYRAMTGVVGLVSGLVILAEIYRLTRDEVQPVLDWFRERLAERVRRGSRSDYDLQ